MNQITASIKIKDVLYRGEDGYSILKVDILTMEGERKPSSEKIVTGTMGRVMIGDHFNIEGHWNRSKRYGWQIQMDDYKFTLPAEKDAIIDYLAKLEGIGRVTARKICNRHGVDTFKIIKSNYEELIKINGISASKARNIYEQIMRNENIDEINLYLTEKGLSPKQVFETYNRFGESTISKMQENPFILEQLTENPLTFRQVDKIAQSFGISCNDPRRIDGALKHMMKERVLGEGHLYYPMAELVSIAQIELAKSFKQGIPQASIKAELIEKGIRRLVAKKAFIKEKDAVYEKYAYWAEYGITENLFNLLTGGGDIPEYSQDTVAQALTEYESSTGICLHTHQKEAVITALSKGFSIITGGPGTGKTQVLKAITHVLAQLSPWTPAISLAAPTGKAAKRMTEMTGISAKTIHRTINLKVGGAKAEAELFHDLVIVDEASMIDAQVFRALLEAISERTRVVLVGDYEQLPSVGPGLILRDLIESGYIPVTRLTKIFRQKGDSLVPTNAQKIIEGKKIGDPDGPDVSHPKEFWLREPKENESVVELTINALRYVMDHFNQSLDDIQILTPTNIGSSGANVLNEVLQWHFNPHAKTDVYVEIPGNATKIYIGDKVIQTQNDYELMVFNGEVGTVVEIHDYPNGKILIVDMGDRSITYTEEACCSLNLAYALTVHKSQGSEYMTVIMPVAETHTSILNRNLIYTAITRAKERAFLIGLIETFNQAIDKKDSTERFSQLKNRIEKKLAPNQQAAS